MQITNAQTATEYVNDWMSASPARRVSMFTAAIESQEFCRDMCESRGRRDEMWGHIEAIGVIKRARYQANIERGMRTIA